LHRPGKFFYDRRFPRPADGEVPDANDQTPERALAKNSFSVEEKTKPDELPVNPRESKQQRAQKRGANSASPFQDNVDPELFQRFKTTTHVVNDECRMSNDEFLRRDYRRT
jgi:hypothetical protein